jgi:hypothetical protein
MQFEHWLGDKRMVNADELRALLHYEPETGMFTWRVKPSRRIAAGTVAGHVRADDGYISIQIDGVPYFAHRLAWLYMSGNWSIADIDHRDTVRSNNAFANLREAADFPNQQNIRKATCRSSTGVLGVFPSGTSSTRFRASVRVSGKNLGLGTFGSKTEAYAAYVIAKRKLHLGCTL